jgi:WD40 repeat protein
LKETPEDAADLQRVIRVNLAAWQHQTHHLQAFFELGLDAEAVFTPDGATLVAWSRSSLKDPKREARVFDASTGQRIGTPFGGPLPTASGPSSLNRVLPGPWLLSPDGQVLLALSDMGTAQLWDVAKRQPVGPPLVHEENFLDGVMFSADSRTLLTSAIREEVTQGPGGGVRSKELPGSSIRLWEAGTGKPIGKPIKEAGRFGPLALSPDGQTVVTGGRDKTLQLWNAATGSPVGGSLPPPNPSFERVGSATFSPDSRTLLAVYSDPATRKDRALFWDVAEGKNLGKPVELETIAPRVMFSPDGKLVLAYGIPGGGTAVQLVNVDTQLGHTGGQNLALRRMGWKCSGDRVLEGAFSPDGRTFLTRSERKTSLWDVATGNPISAPIPHDSSSLAFHPNGRAFLGCARNDLSGVQALQLWEVAAGGPRALWCSDSIDMITAEGGMGTEEPVHYPLGLDSPLRRRITSVGLKGGLGVEPGSIDVFGGQVLNGLGFGTSGETLLTTFRAEERDKEYVFAQTQDSGTGKPTDRVLDVADGQAIALAPDGNMLLTVAVKRLRARQGGVIETKYSDDKSLRLWQPGTWEAIGPPRTVHYRGGIWDAVLSRDGSKVLLVGESAQLWEVSTGSPLAPSWPVSTRILALSGDGKLALVQTAQGAELRDAATGDTQGPPLRHQGEVVAAAFSPDGRKLVTGSNDRTARVWEVPGVTPCGIPLHHEATVSAVAFSPDGRTILTGTEEGTTRFWDLATGKRLGPSLRQEGFPKRVEYRAIRLLAYAPDGRTVATGTAVGHVRLWPAPSEPLEGSAERLALWVSTLTDRDLDAAGVVGGQKPEDWQENRRRLAALGGPPVAPDDGRA